MGVEVVLVFDEVSAAVPAAKSGLPAEVVLPAGGSLRELAGQHPATNFGPLIHVSIHSWASVRIWER